MHFLTYFRTLNERRLEWILLSVAVLLGALHAWAGRYTMNPDGISYLDMGDAFWRGDWAMAINAYWSPLYAIILGFWIRIIQPSLWAEFPLVHAINFLIYLAALFSFRFFLHELQKESVGRAWLCFGYTLFLVATTNLITLALVSPDMLVAAFVFAISGIMIRMYQENAHVGNFVWLGILFGFAYFTKAVFFPLGFIFLGATAFLKSPLKMMVPRVMISLFIFLSIASMLIIPISFKRGRFTFGDAGKLTYAWHVNSVTRHIHWQGEDDRFGTPLHPTRKIFDNPIVYEFAHPIRGTYPPWYDPSYWYEGLKTHIDIKVQINALLFNSRLLYELLVTYQLWSVLVGLSIVFLLHARDYFRKPFYAIASAWPLFLPSLAAIGFYLSVIIQARYIAPFLAVLFIVLWWRLQHSALLVDTRINTHYISQVIGGALALFLFLPVSIATIEKAMKPVSTKHQQIAAFLRENGLRTGDKVAVVGDYFYAREASWARLARAFIIAEIPPDFSNTVHFWTNKDTQSAVLALLNAHGARMIIAGDPINNARLDHWQPIAGTSAYVLFFPNPQEDQKKKEGK